MEITTQDTKETTAINFAVVKAVDLKKEVNVIYCLGGNSLEGRPKQTFWKDKTEMEKYRLAQLGTLKRV